MNAQPKHLHANRDAPERSCQEGDIEERRRRQAEQHRRKGVEQREDERVSREIPADLPIPRCAAERRAVENARLRAVDEHTPESELADDFVEGPLADEPLLKDVGEAVEGGAEEGEEVAFDLVCGAEVVGACDVVGAEDYAETADAEEDAEDLRVVVADLEEEEGDYYDDGDGPEVDELGAEDRGLDIPVSIFLLVYP